MLGCLTSLTRLRSLGLPVIHTAVRVDVLLLVLVHLNAGVASIACSLRARCVLAVCSPLLPSACRNVCIWREWYTANASHTLEQTYGIESLMHEMMLQSPHRCGGLRRPEVLAGCTPMHAGSAEVLTVLATACSTVGAVLQPLLAVPHSTPTCLPALPHPQDP